MSEISREGLLQIVREAWTGHDPVPADLVARMQAVAAAADTDLDLELMLLVERSAEAAGARGHGTAYTLRFEYGAMQLLLRVYGNGDAGRIDGWVTPPTALTVRALTVRGAPHEWVAEAGARGRFELTGLPQGLVRLRLEPGAADAPVLGTPAFEI